MRLAELANQEFAIWGFGREGLSVYRAIRRAHPTKNIAILSDTPLGDAARQSVADDPNVMVGVGAQALENLQDFQVIVKSPGVSLYRPEIIVAKQNGVRITSASNIWFSENPNRRVICVSGTKGKSTTATLIWHCLHQLGHKAVLGGNVGRALLELEDDEPNAVVIAELSSYQISDLVADPLGVLFLNVYPEHLDWHGGFAQYRSDKLRLLDLVRPDGFRIVDGKDEQMSQYIREHGIQGVLTFGTEDSIHFAAGKIWEGQTELCSVKDFHLIGEHNFNNVAAALTALGALGVNPRDASTAVTSFRGLPHRLFIAGEIRGLTFVDDSIATVPQAVMAAVKGFQGRPISLIVGGYDRGLDWQDFADFLCSAQITNVICLPDSGRKIAAAIARLVQAGDGPRCFLANDMKEAVGIAELHTPSGGVVLLSPAAPSFGQFRDFEERGEQFLAHAGFK